MNQQEQFFENQEPTVKLDLYPEIPKLKSIKNKKEIDVRYCLIAPFAYAHIYWNPRISEVIYEIEEPSLSEEEKIQLAELRKAMKELVNLNEVTKRKQEDLMKYVDDTLKLLLEEFGWQMTFSSYQKIFYYLYRDFIGLGKIEPLIRDYFVEDIECNGSEAPVYVVHRVFRNLKTNVRFRENEALASFVEKIAQKTGKYISYANPILDGSLPDGSRVNATYTKDITSKGPTFTIRKFTKTPWTPIQLVAFNTLSPEMMAYLWLLVENKMNILIAGGTSSGKTTLLNAIAFFIPPEARVVSIEDTRELNLPRENWLPSVARDAVGTNKSGEVDLFQLLKNSFRQNPDYVIVGEVRGKEAYVLFQGMASGHSSISTLHAESVDTVIKRLETPPINLSPTLLNVLDCVCVMTHAIVKKQETRKLREIVEIVNITPQGIAMTNTPFMWNPRDDQFYFKKDSKIIQKISNRTGVPVEELNMEFQRRVQLIYKMFEMGILEFRRVQEVVSKYYKNPEDVLNKFGIQ